MRAHVALSIVVLVCGCERAKSGQRSDEGSNAIVPPPADAAIADASVDALTDAATDAPIDARVVVILKSDLPIWPEIHGPTVKVPRDGTRSLAGVRFRFAGFGSGTGPNGGLAMIGLVAAKGGAKEEVNLSSRGGHDPEFLVFGGGFVITSIGGESLEIMSVPHRDIDCTKLIGALVDKLGIREEPKPDEIQGFTIAGDGIVSQNHNGFTIECGSITGRLAVTPPSAAKIIP